jgi:hypothetical protein
MLQTYKVIIDMQAHQYFVFTIRTQLHVCFTIIDILWAYTSIPERTWEFT